MSCLKIYVIFSTMKTGSTTLFNRIGHSVTDPVLHTHNMEVASVKNMNKELEQRIVDGCVGLRGEKSVFENEEVYRITGDVASIFRPGDQVYLITAVRDPLSQKMSHILHGLNLYNIFDEQIYSGSEDDTKKYLYEYLGRLLLDTTSKRNIYFEYVNKEKSLVPTEFILGSWEPRRKRKCDYIFSLKYIIQKLLRQKESIIDKRHIMDNGFVTINNTCNDGVIYNVLIIKTENLDQLVDVLSDFIGSSVKYYENHRNKYGKKTMYISKDDIHTVIKSIKQHAVSDPHIIELYRDDMVKDLGYAIPQ